MSHAIELKENDILFKQGDLPDAMYIIKSGKINLIKHDNGKDILIDTVSAGGLIGEMGLFDMQVRSATAKAAEPSELIRLPYLQLESQLQSLPEWVRIVMKKMSEKIRSTNERLKG